MGLSDFLDTGGDSLRHSHVACAFCADDAHADDWRAIELGKSARLLNRVGHPPQIIQADFAAGRQADLHRVEFGECFGAGHRSDGLIEAADFGAAPGQIDIAAAELAADIERCQSDGLQHERIEADPDLALDATNAFDATHTLDALQRADQNVLNEIRQLLRRFSRSDGRIGEDRKTGDIDTPDQRLVDAARQVGAYPPDCVRHIGNGPIDINADSKIESRHRDAVGDRRSDVTRARHTGERVFDLFRDLGFKLTRAGRRTG